MRLLNFIFFLFFLKTNFCSNAFFPECQIGKKSVISYGSNEVLVVGADAKIKNIFSNGNVLVRKDTLVSGNVSAVGNFLSENHVVVEGNVRAQFIVTNPASPQSQTIKGQIVSGANVAPLVMPWPTGISPSGTESVSIRRGSISPGSYKDLEFKDGGDVLVEPGSYYVRSLTFGKGVTVRFPDDTQFVIDSNLKIEKDVHVKVEYYENLKFFAGGKVDIDTNDKILNAIVYSKGAIELKEKSRFCGCLQGNKVNLEDGVDFSKCTNEVRCPDLSYFDDGLCCPISEFNSNGICCPFGSYNSFGNCCPVGSSYSISAGKAVCCPNNQLNDDGTCCPVGSHFFPGPNSKGACCPENQTLSISGDAMQCCPLDEPFLSSDNRLCCSQSGEVNCGGVCCSASQCSESICCGVGHHFSVDELFPGSGELCCPVDQKNVGGICCPSTSASNLCGGQCCASGLCTSTINSGTARCCPTGTTVQSASSQQDICCPTGEINVEGICCPSESSSVLCGGQCVPKGYKCTDGNVICLTIQINVEGICCPSESSSVLCGEQCVPPGFFCSNGVLCNDPQTIFLIDVSPPNWSATGWSLVSPSSIANGGIALNPPNPDQKGQAFWRTPFFIGGTIQFKFTYTIDQCTSSPGDGMALVLASTSNVFPIPTSTGLGEYIGYAGIPRSIALELDTVNNGNQIDMNSNSHIGIHSRGALPNSHDVSVAGVGNQYSYPQLTNNKVIVFTMEYVNDASSNLKVFIPAVGASPVISTSYPMRSTFGSTMYFGFTSATGGLSCRHSVDSVTVQYLQKMGDCSGECVDLSSDPRNCGSCGTVCPVVANAYSFCSVELCQTLCLNGFKKCGSACVNTDTDPNNCGACGSLCPTGCSSGRC